MKVYISTNALSGNYHLSKILSFYHRQKINQIELSSSNHLEKNPLKIIKSYQQKYQTTYLVHNYFPPPVTPFVFNLASSNPKVIEKSLTLAKNALQLCAKIGSPFYSFHGGLLFDGTGELETQTNTFKINSSILHPGEARENFLSKLKQLLSFAEKIKVKLLIENNVCPPSLKDKMLFVDENDFLWLFSKIKSRNIGILLDLGHLKVSAATYHLSPERIIQKLAKKIIALHLHDNNGKADLHLPIKKHSRVIKTIKAFNQKKITLILEARLKSIQKILQQKKLLENL